jgi:hypothetical protein
MTARPTTRILLPALPCAAPLSEAVLFGFDDLAFPYQNHLQTHLTPGQNPRLVLDHGHEGAHDEVLLYYGTVLRIDDTFHMWYNANHGPLQNQIGYERVHCCIGYATSPDGVRWERPALGLVEFGGSRRNNIVDLPVADLWSTGAVLYDPEDPAPGRRFKMAFEARFSGQLRFCVAFSPDGLRWTPSPMNPVGPFLEMAGVTRFRGLYYVNGQAALTAHRPTITRRLVTFASADFEHWSPCGAVGLDRGPDVTGPSTGADAHQYEEVHLGAALWNRGNVLVGIYGQWHGHFSGDRRLVTMDLGLALSHDAIHFREPVPGFRLVPAREQPASPRGVAPALMQGQGMENVGDQTLYWYSLWRGTEGSGVRLVTWPRDRLGMLKPFHASSPQAISGPIRVLEGEATLTMNASGLGERSALRVGLLDEGFRPLPGFGADDAEPIHADGFCRPLSWKGGERILPSHGPVRLDVRFEGHRPEDARLHAVYVGSPPNGAP